MFGLTEPIALVTFFSEEPTEELMALGMRNYWDGYFASRAAPLGRDVPAEVVHAIFYNFGPGEAARHIPAVWDLTTPEAALAARERGAARALRRILGDVADSPGLVRAADLATKSATSAPTEGRPLYAALRTVAIPDDPVARLWHATTLLREHRGDGHIAALMAEGIGGLECHILVAVDMGMPGERFGRVHHLPPELLAATIGGLRDRGLLDDEGRFTPAGRETKDRIEAMTDALAGAPYDALEPTELDELMAVLEPISEVVDAAGSR
jgi:hypothetical protein